MLDSRNLGSILYTITGKNVDYDFLFSEFVMGSPHLTSEEVMNYSNVEDSLPNDYGDGDHGANEAAMTDDESSSDEEMAERLRRLKE